MIKQHKALLETLQRAYDQATSLLKTGQQVQGIMHQINWAIRETRGRLTYLEEAQNKNVSAVGEKEPTG
jgi:uncharacterized membrane protein YcaP (DUF421 family)